MMKLSPGRERLLWMSFTVALLFISLVEITRLKREARETARQVKITAQREQQLIGSLHSLTETLRALKKSRLLDESEVAYLKGRGLKDPVKDLLADLQKHPELIHDTGVLGGKMGFFSPLTIHVLDTRWVFAGFEDGHNAGNALLQYEVSNGKISWQLIDSYIQE